MKDLDQSKIAAMFADGLAQSIAAMPYLISYMAHAGMDPKSDRVDIAFDGISRLRGLDEETAHLARAISFALAETREEKTDIRKIDKDVDTGALVHAIEIHPFFKKDAKDRKASQSDTSGQDRAPMSDGHSIFDIGANLLDLLDAVTRGAADGAVSSSAAAAAEAFLFRKPNPYSLIAGAAVRSGAVGGWIAGYKHMKHFFITDIWDGTIHGPNDPNGPIGPQSGLPEGEKM